MSWGHGASGCLGLSSTQSHCFPTVLPALLSSSIVYIEAGAYHNVAISDTGELFTWGRGDVNQLGHEPGELTQDDNGWVVLTPKALGAFAARVVGAACGEAHTLVLDSGGHVYAFGWAEAGQLGLYSAVLCENVVNKGVQRITSLEKVIKVSAGSLFSCCLRKNGEVLVWGSGGQGQLGLGKETTSVCFPQSSLYLLEEVLDIACGETHMFCVTRSGAYAWGQGTAGVIPDYLEGSELACFQPQCVSLIEDSHRILLN